MTLTLGVVIPIYIRSAVDLVNLENTLTSIERQKSRPLEIIVSDDSDETHLDSTKVVLSNFPGLNILYRRNSGPRGISSNSNNGISYLTTDYVHCLHQDDSIIGDDLYLRVLRIFQVQKLEWALLGGTAESHRIVPRLVKGFLPAEALCGLNTIGGPSCVIFPNNPSLRFNLNYNMLCDVAFFFDAQKQMGAPQIIADSYICYGMGEWQEQRRIEEGEVFGESRELFEEHRGLLKNSVFRVFRYSKRYEVKMRALRLAQSFMNRSAMFWIIQFAIVCIQLRLQLSKIGRGLKSSLSNR
jgi:glycosyltransferase involved in cell wall biosynthesis